MKAILLILASFTASAWATSTAPVCDGIGTRSEGWYRDGVIMTNANGPMYDQCENKIAICAAKGSKSEGWYAIEQGFLLTYDSCANAAENPECEAIGTKSEGWYVGGKLMLNAAGSWAWDQCEDKTIYCGAIGARSEGWYVSNTKRPRLLTWAQCAEN